MQMLWIITNDICSYVIAMKTIDKITNGAITMNGIAIDAYVSKQRKPIKCLWRQKNDVIMKQFSKMIKKMH